MSMRSHVGTFSWMIPSQRLTMAVVAWISNSLDSRDVTPVLRDGNPYESKVLFDTTSFDWGFSSLTVGVLGSYCVCYWFEWLASDWLLTDGSDICTLCKLCECSESAASLPLLFALSAACFYSSRLCRLMLPMLTSSGRLAFWSCSRPSWASSLTSLL